MEGSTKKKVHLSFKAGTSVLGVGESLTIYKNDADDANIVKKIHNNSNIAINLDQESTIELFSCDKIIVRAAVASGTVGSAFV